MAGEWEVATIGEIATLQRGFDISKKEQTDGAVPVISSGGIGSYHDEAKHSGPGVLLGRKGTLGSVYWTDLPHWPHSTTLWVKDFHGNDPKFVYYFFKAMGPELLRMDVGAANPTLNRNHVHPLPALRPPLPEQRAIAHVLGTLDDLIELNRETNEILEDMARALFKSWFVDFDPVRRNKDEGGRMKDDNSTSSTFIPHPSSFDHLFPDHFQDSELGQIPKGWEVKTVGDIGDVICGKTPPTSVSDYYGNDIPFITIPDMHGNVFGAATGRRLSLAGANSQTKKTLPPGSICVSCIATPGLVVITSENSQTNQQINSIVPHQKEETYFWYWVMTGLGAEIASSGSGGSVLVNLSKSRFETLRVIQPPSALVRAYHNSVRPFFESILENSHESRDLATLRDTLLPKLLSGEVSAPVAAAELAAATSAHS